MFSVTKQKGINDPWYILFGNVLFVKSIPPLIPDNRSLIFEDMAEEGLQLIFIVHIPGYSMVNYFAWALVSKYNIPFVSVLGLSFMISDGERFHSKIFEFQVHTGSSDTSINYIHAQWFQFS
jgi:hypothetical protein